MTTQSPNTEKPTITSRARGSTKLLAAAFLGSAIGLLGAVAILVVLSWNRPTELTRSEFDAAQQRWRAAAIDDYDIEIMVTGIRAATYRVQVRGGNPASATIDGRALKNRRTFGTWSVPGMFNTIESDVEHVERRLTEADPRSARLTLFATFDELHGYPKKYHRIEWGEAGSDSEVTWEVTVFEKN